MFAVPEFTVPTLPADRALSPAALLRAAAADATSLRRLARFEPARPASILLPDTGLVLVGWLPGQHADPASYPDSGAFAVVAGEIVEYAGGATRTLRAGQIRLFGPGYRHQLANLGTANAVTAHTPPARW